MHPFASVIVMSYVPASNVVKSSDADVNPFGPVHANTYGVTPPDTSMSIVPSGSQPDKLNPPAKMDGVIKSRLNIVGSITTI